MEKLLEFVTRNERVMKIISSGIGAAILGVGAYVLIEKMSDGADSDDNVIDATWSEVTDDTTTE